MQASLLLPPISPASLAPTRTLALPWACIPKLKASKCPQLKATNAANENATVDYTSMTSVFPSEACETIGGEACDAKVYPEVKLKPEANKRAPRPASDQVDRDYLEYDGSKTVFPGEACDDLGGEFCDPDYQKGVY